MPKMTIVPMPKKTDVKAVCKELATLQRRWQANVSTRNMLENRTRMVVASFTGYHSGQEEEDRKAMMTRTDATIDRVLEGDTKGVDDGAVEFIRDSYIAISTFNVRITFYSKEIETWAGKLPVSVWVKEEAQKGFALKSLGQVVGACGDLANYANPAKVWKRMGCAPYERDGATQMPATWRSTGGLSNEDWTEIGYRPRRWSIAYVIGENLLKLNFFGKGDDKVPGPYRAKYDHTKAVYIQNHPECGEKGLSKTWTPQRAHRHGMLCATKMLLRNLWCQWNRKPVIDHW